MKCDQFERVQELAPLFIEDLTNIAEKNPFALFFNTYERTANYLDGWLRDVLCSKYGELDLAVIIVIAGRYELNQDWTYENFHHL